MSNKVHVNNSTRISLNDRFTIMQSVGVPAPTAGPSGGAPMMRRPRSRSRSRSRSVGRMAQSVSPMTSPRVQAILPAARSRLARHYEDVIERRHHDARAPQPMRMKPAIRNVSAKQRLALAMSNRGPGAMASMRATRRPLARPRNARAALATMQMDRMAASVPSRRGIRGRLVATTATTLRQRRLNRAVATVNQAGGRRLSRMDLVRSMNKANLIRQRSRSRSNVNQAAVAGQPVRGRSRSRSNLQPARSQSNLRRSNSRLNLNQAQQQQQQPRRKINRDFQQRSRSRSRQNTPSIASRLGVRPGGNGNNVNNGGTAVAGGRRQRARSNSVSARLGGAGKQGGLNRVAQGRVSKQQRLGGQKKPLANNGKRNQNIGNNKPAKQMTRGRGGPLGKKNLQAAVGAGKRGKKVSALQQRLQKGGGQKQPQQQQRGKQQQQRGPQQQGPGKGRRGKRGAGAGAPKRSLKKEDLDKELDKYMSTNN